MENDEGEQKGGNGLERNCERSSKGLKWNVKIKRERKLKPMLSSC